MFQQLHNNSECLRVSKKRTLVACEVLCSVLNATPSMEEDSGSSEDEIVSLEEEGDWWMVGEEESTGKQKKK